MIMTRKGFKKNHNINKSILIVFFLLFFSFFYLFLFSDKISNFFYKLSEPIQNSFWESGNFLSNIFYSVLNSGELKKEKDRLTDERITFITEIARLKNLEEENNVLRQALELNLKKDFNLVFARVFGRSIKEDSVLINKGSVDGMYVGMPVITEDKIIVGQISEVYKNYSKINLISHPESVFNVEVQGKNIIGIVRGEGRFRLNLDFVSKTADLQEEDILLTGSAEKIFPPNLFVGLVRDIQRSDLEPFQKSRVVSFLNIRNIRNVFVIKDWKI